MKKAVVLFSGGKDSCLALHKSRKKFDLIGLATILPKNFDSFMFHKPYENLLEKQAEMLGLKLIVQKSSGVEEEELDDLKKLFDLIKKMGAEVVVIGGIASNYQGDRIKKIASDFDLEIYAPLWNYTPEKLWGELFDNKFEIIFTKVSCDGLTKNWVGVKIDDEKFMTLKKLSEKYKFKLDLEGGEAESAVLNMPGFEKRIEISFRIKSEGEHRHWIEGLRVL